jgi:DNA-binding IclR family transcriptional regulator
MFSSAGKVGPAYCTGVGKAMLAFLTPDERAPVLEQQSYHPFTSNTLVSQDALVAELNVIRKRGHAFDREEHEPGIICVALPIRSDTGRVLGAVSVTSTRERTTLESLEAIVPRIRSTADAIADAVQNWRFPDEAPTLSQTGT